MPDERDETLDRIVAELKTLPAVPADATARVLARIDAERRAGGVQDASSAADDDVIFFPTATDEMAIAPAPSPVVRRARRLVLSLPAAIGWALAATLAGFLIRGALPLSAPAGAEVAALSEDVSPSVDAGAQAGAESVLTAVANVSSRVADEAPVVVQFVLAAPGAASVALVGDFNGWDAAATPLRHDAASGLWRVELPVRPGRHVYAYVVDDSVRTLDPRAPRAVDPDYGTEQSVIIVGNP